MDAVLSEVDAVKVDAGVGANVTVDAAFTASGNRWEPDDRQSEHAHSLSGVR